MKGDEIKMIDSEDYGHAVLFLEQEPTGLVIYIHLNGCEEMTLSFGSDAETIEWFENADAESVSLAIQDINESEGEQ